MRQVHRSILDAVLGINPLPKTLLDIGCGNGSFTRELHSGLPSMVITALDFRFPKYLKGQTSVRFIAGSAEELPFDSESFDAITVSLSLHHWKNKEKGISEVYRVLKTKGHLVIGDPLLQGWLSKPVMGWLAQKIDGGTFAATAELTAHLKGAGFKYVNMGLIPNSMQSLFLVTAVKS